MPELSPQPVKTAAKAALKTVGLLRPATAVWRRARSRAVAEGFGFWWPLVPREAYCACITRAIALLEARGHAIGDYVEFGVSRGDSMAAAFKAFEQAGLHEVRLIGFDSFKGLPPEVAQEGWTPGDYHSSERAARRNLMQQGVDMARVRLVKGWFRDTANAATRARLRLDRASIILLDCDAYTPTKEALWFAADLIRNEAVLLFDDWGSRLGEGEIGQRESFAEWRAAFPRFEVEPLEPYHEGARVFLVTRTGG